MGSIAVYWLVDIGGVSGQEIYSPVRDRKHEENMKLRCDKEKMETESPRNN